MTAKHFTSLRPYTLDLVEHSVNWMDQYWDQRAGLLSMKTYERLSHLPMVHHIRETSWYALGLLQRGGDADKQRACQALETILKYQFDEPGAAYDGTWYRFPQEPHPGNMKIWRGYDPNWREFIGTTLAIILLDYEQDLPSTLVEGIDTALQRAIRGALTRDLPATYSNIALMNAFLLLFTGKRFGNPEWVSAGEEFAREIHRLFAAHDAFSEFNSPTYYGIDLYALGLWHSYSSSPLLQELGAEMEQALWRDIALMYHAGMKNIAGPFDRSYGMDLQRYVSTIGMWIWMIVGREAAPFPDITRPFEHAHDFCIAPLYAAVDVRIPVDVFEHLLTFQGEHLVERVIADAPRRVVTAWIGNNLLLGGEDTSYSQPASNQIHPATIHWTSVNNEIGWVRLVYATPVNAHAEKDKLTISCIAQGENTPDFVFQVHTPVKTPETIAPDLWQLPGLTIHVETNAYYVQTREHEGYYEVSYTAKNIVPGTTILLTLTTS